MKLKYLFLTTLVGLALALPLQVHARPGGGSGGHGGGHSFSGGGGGGGGHGSHAAPSRMGGMYGGAAYRGSYARYNGVNQLNRTAQFNRGQPSSGRQFNRTGQLSRNGQGNRGAQLNRAGQSNRPGAANNVARNRGVGPHFSNGKINSGGAKIVAKHPANWHSNWSHNHDHIWHGHHCRWVHNSWVVFDYGFYDPFWWGYPYYPYSYGYPYDYSGYGGSYDDSYYGDNSQVYPGQDAGESEDSQYQGSDSRHSDNGSPVAIAQSRLARLGYYHGEVDGMLGPNTRRAISDYQKDHGMRVTGSVSGNTLSSIGGNQ